MKEEDTETNVETETTETETPSNVTQTDFGKKPDQDTGERQNGDGEHQPLTAQQLKKRRAMQIELIKEEITFTQLLATRDLMRECGIRLRNAGQMREKAAVVGAAIQAGQVPDERIDEAREQIRDMTDLSEQGFQIAVAIMGACNAKQ